MTADMQTILEKQKAAFTAAMPEPMSVRRDRMDRALALLVDYKDEFAKAVSADFGHRSTEQTLMTDIMPSVSALKHAKKHFESWARNEKRKPTFPLGLIGAKADVVYQPKGVVGVIAPWNFPIGMVMVPMAGILAAGNRAMIKPSEFTERVADVFAEVVPKYFAEEEMAVFTGGVEVGTAFSKLAFDHLIFTGATSVGKHIMRAAADNLVPVTLELGGKSPVVISDTADIAKTAARVMQGKTMNAGQICLAPDYVLAPKQSVDGFVTEAKAAVAKMYPTLKDNGDYTAMINQRHYDRVKGLIADARAKGAEVIEINPAGEDFSQQEHRKIPPTLIVGATDEMSVMQEEIFGPVLPIRTYQSLDGAIAEINARPRPLALYYFGEDDGESECLLSRTHSGGVTVNDVIFHFSMDDLPFGGVGASGIGAYHGRRGFIEFSHEKAVYRQMKSELLAMLRPPYGETFRKQIASRLKP